MPPYPIVLPFSAAGAECLCADFICLITVIHCDNARKGKYINFDAVKVIFLCFCMKTQMCVPPPACHTGVYRNSTSKYLPSHPVISAYALTREDFVSAMSVCPISNTIPLFLRFSLHCVHNPSLHCSLLDLLIKHCPICLCSPTVRPSQMQVSPDGQSNVTLFQKQRVETL